MPEKEARLHHYIPQFYLRGFSHGGGKCRRIVVGSIKGERFFETNPRNVGAVRDFNRSNVPGRKPDFLEGELAVLEDKAARSIKSVVASRTFCGDDRNVILNLASILCTRSPQMRNWISQMFGQFIKKMTDVTLESKEQFDYTIERGRAEGKKPPEDLSYEKLLEFHRRGEYTINMTKEAQLGTEFSGADAVLTTLANRKWILYTTTEKEGYFVTSDRPALLSWIDPHLESAGGNAPAHALPNTAITFPLAKEAALVGTLEPPCDAVIEADEEIVAQMNITMITHSFEQFYSAKQTFPYKTRAGELLSDSHFMNHIKEFKRAPL